MFVKLTMPNGVDTAYVNVGLIESIVVRQNEVSIVSSSSVRLGITPQEFEKKLLPLLVNEPQVLKG